MTTASSAASSELLSHSGKDVKIPSLIMREEMKNSGESMAFLQVRCAWWASGVCLGRVVGTKRIKSQSGLAKVIKEVREYIALELKASDAEAKLAATLVAWSSAAEENDATREQPTFFFFFF